MVAIRIAETLTVTTNLMASFVFQQRIGRRGKAFFPLVKDAIGAMKQHGGYLKKCVAINKDRAALR